MSGQALAGLRALHDEAASAVQAIGSAPELSDPMRRGLLDEVDVLATRIADLARVAHAATEAHRLAVGLAVINGKKGGRRG